MLVRNAVGNDVPLLGTKHFIVLLAVFVGDTDSYGCSMFFGTRKRGSQVSLYRESIVIGLKCGLSVMCRLVPDGSE